MYRQVTTPWLTSPNQKMAAQELSILQPARQSSKRMPFCANMTAWTAAAFSPESNPQITVSVGAGGKVATVTSTVVRVVVGVVTWDTN